MLPDGNLTWSCWLDLVQATVGVVTMSCPKGNSQWQKEVSLARAEMSTERETIFWK